jgi:hypothetical protein
MFEKMQKELNDAIDQVRVAKLSAFSAAYQLALGNKSFEEDKAVTILEGIEGKNAEQRAANLRVILREDFNGQAMLQNDYNEARHEAELAELELTRVKLTIRLIELSP